MGIIGKVIKSYISKLSGSSRDAQFGSTEEFAGDERTVQYFGPCNEDFAPPESCETYNVSLGSGAGYLISTAYHNQLITPVAVHGERRIFSTNQAGDTVMSEVFLKQDGEILIKNGKATITIDASGEITIDTGGEIEITSSKTIINNDVDIVGNLNVTGTIGSTVSVTAPNVVGSVDVSSGGKSGLNHTHAQGNDSGGSSEAETNAPS